ncbi:MAG: PqqD family protein [Bacteroidales bacterium]|nr:PqqD family protein [Bacteroidales bacterium]
MNYHLNDAKMFADVTDGIAIIINSLTGIYYGMNGLGTEMFDALLKGASEADILAAFKALPGAPDDCEARLQAFIDTLLGFEVIVPASTVSSAPVTLVEKDAVFDKFTPTCNEYNDVQELLFADPIHEVKEDEGWKPEK